MPAILSKLTRERYQGFGQGLRRTIASAATVLGPLWAGAMSEHIHTFLGLMIGALFVLLLQHAALLCIRVHLSLCVYVCVSVCVSVCVLCRVSCVVCRVSCIVCSV